MKLIPLGRLAIGLGILFLPPFAYGQTANWTGGSALSASLDWNDAAHWDSGVVPNSTTSVAVINNSEVATSFPGGGIRISSSTINLDELRFATTVASGSDTWAQRVLVTAPYTLPPVGSTLNLHGVGITTANGTGANPRYIVSVGNGSQLHFYNNATISGSNVYVGLENPYSGFSGGVEFHDRSSAGNATLSMHGSGSVAVTFHDQSTAATASIEMGTLTFADQSSAGSARITTYAFGSTVLFRDQSSAGNAFFNLSRYGTVIFADQSTGGTSRVGFSLESGADVRDQADVSGVIFASARDASGSIIGSGRLDISAAAGNVTVGGLDGSVRVNLGANTLILGPSAVDQLLSGGIAGSGGLVLDTGRVVTVALSKVFSPSENTYTGPTEIRSGTLNLAGGRVSATTIATGARLTGTGTVDGHLVNAGTLLPGNSTGAILVTGNFTQNPTGTLNIKILSPTDYDRLAVAGTATLGGTLNLAGAGGLPPAGNATISFLSAGTISGRFEVVNSGPALGSGLGAARTAQLVYSATGVTYQVTQAPFADFGGSSPAAKSLGAHLDANMAGASGTYLDLLVSLNSLATAAQVGTALEALAPDRYSVLAENGFATASARHAATDRRLSVARTSASPVSGVFFEAGTRSEVFDATDTFTEVRSHLSRSTIGGMWRHHAVLFGASLTYETGDIDLDQSGSTDDFRSITPELFVQYDTGRFFMNASIAQSADNHDLRRRINYADFDQTATAGPSGSRLDLGVTAGIPFTASDWTITPAAGVLASKFKVDDFAESHALVANMAISGWTNHSLRSHIGVETAWNAGKITHRLAVRWWHEFEDDRSLTTRFAAAQNSYLAAGREAETDVAEASLAVTARLGRKTVGYLSMGGAWGRRSHLTSEFAAGLSRTF